MVEIDITQPKTNTSVYICEFMFNASRKYESLQN